MLWSAWERPVEASLKTDRPSWPEHVGWIAREEAVVSEVLRRPLAAGRTPPAGDSARGRRCALEPSAAALPRWKTSVPRLLGPTSAA